MKLYFEYEKGDAKTIAVTHISREENLTPKDIENFILSIRTLITPYEQSIKKCSVCGLSVDTMEKFICYDKKCPLKGNT